MPATLEDIRPVAAERHDDGEFVDLGWRPIFKEHTNTRDFDGPVNFDGAAMKSITARCNERCEGGDFVPIVVRHTKEDGSFDPEVVGLAGPFRAQKLKSGVWGIYAKWRLYKQDADKSRKYPRVSVEYWGSKSDPKNGYFDPISLLGAETPELDLGVHYQANPNDSDRTLVRYSKVWRYEAAAGGSNSFAPTDIEEEPQRYQSGGTLSQADLQQIIAALGPTIKEAVDSAVAAMQPAGADPEHLLTPESEDATEEAIPGESPEGESPGESPEDHMGPTDDELNFEAPGDDADDSDPDDADKDGDTDIDDESAEDGKKPAKSKPAQYSADGRESLTIFTEEPDMATEDTAVEVARYKKEAADYRKKHDELQAKYQKVVDENTTLKTELQAVNAEKAKAVRYQKLSAVQGEGYTFDIDTEMKDCEELNDQQFDRHIERIKANYQRIPGTLGSSGLKVAGPARTAKDDRNDAKKRARYSKLATDNCLAANKNPDRSKHLEFPAEFERLMAEDPEKISSQAA